MYIDTIFPPGIGRVGQFMRLVADFERDEIEAAVDGFIAMLDAQDGDPDIETGGAEDEALTGHAALMIMGPGCSISDVDCGGEEASAFGGGGDLSWTEWHNRGRHKTSRFGAEIVGRDRHGQLLEDDAEDDDPREDDDPAEDPDNDRCSAGHDHMIGGPVARIEWWRECDQPGSGEDGEFDARQSPSPSYRIDRRPAIAATAAL